MKNELDLLKELLQEEIDHTIIKTDTYNKGKFAGIRKAMALIEDIQQGYYKTNTVGKGSADDERDKK